MERLDLVKCRDSDVVYSRTTAKKALDNVIIKIKEAMKEKILYTE